MATHYVTDNEVARFLQVPHFTSSTFPEDAHVEEFINMAEERVDQLTDHAWITARAKTVTEERGRIQRVMSNSVNDRGRIQLRHYPILNMQSGTDKLHIWDGGNYVEYIANKTGDDTITNITGKDYWID